MNLRRQIFFSRWFWQLLLPALALALLPACRGKSQNESRERFKAGLIALDRSDGQTAMMEFERSLAASPQNADARVALASIYAKRGGFPIEAWLTPMLEVGKSVDSRLRAFARTEDGIHLVQKMGEAGFTEEELAKVDGEAVEILAKIQKTSQDIWKAMAALMFAADLFEKFPYLSTDQLADLDRAIKILREDNADPDLRQEKVKIYLSALAFMRVIYYTRAFLSATQLETGKLFTEESRFCKLDAADAKNEIMAIHDSLLALEEGLRVRADSVDQSGPVEARKKLHTFVQERLLGGIWNDLDRFFEDGTEQNVAALRIVSRLCGIGKKPGKDGGQPQDDHETGADLFNPDEE